MEVDEGNSACCDAPPTPLADVKPMDVDVDAGTGSVCSAATATPTVGAGSTRKSTRLSSSSVAHTPTGGQASSQDGAIPMVQDAQASSGPVTSSLASSSRRVSSGGSAGSRARVAKAVVTERDDSGLGPVPMTDGVAGPLAAPTPSGASPH